MRSHRSTVRRRGLLAHVVLAALLLRAYVPIGFMPASGTPFLLELCPASMSMAMPMSMPMSMPMALPMSMPMPMSMPEPASPGHSPLHAHFVDCPFGSAPVAGPISQLLVFEPAGPVSAPADPAAVSQCEAQRFHRSHRPRGPPSLA